MTVFTRLSVLAMALVFSVTAEAGTLDDVKARGHVICGVTPGLAGFGAVNDQGDWVGFDIDFCHAVAAAIFGDTTKAKYRPLTSKERFTALQSGEVDLLSRNTTWTFSRDVNLGLEYARVNYYDGQGFMVPIALGVHSALDLDGARICIQTGTTTELNLSDYFRTHGKTFESVVVGNDDEARANYLAEACDAYTTDISGLAAVRSAFPDPGAHIILPEIISKEPLGLIVRHGDNQWGDIVRWVVNATVLLEELGVSSANVDTLAAESDNPEIRRLLGVEGEFGVQMGLSNDWALKIASEVGNYSEIFERNIGTDSPLGLERGLNALWSDGGILYAPPIR